MSNYVNLNTDCQTSEPRQNVGIGQKKNRYEAQVWYHSSNPQPYPSGASRVGPDKCVVIYFDNLSVWDRETRRMLTMDAVGTGEDGQHKVIYIAKKEG